MSRFSTLLVVATTLLLSGAAAPPRLTCPLSNAQRLQLDILSRAEPRLVIPQEKVNLVGTIPAFILSRLDLPAEEEARRSLASHDDLLRRDRHLPTPDRVQKLVDRLVKELPTTQKPDLFRFQVTILDRADPELSTPGGGYLHLTRGLLDRFDLDREGGEAGLAFLLARQMAHIALGHCRRGWQQVILEEEAQKGIETGIEPSVWRALLETKVTLTGRLAQFLYSLNQESRADLHAFQLCRNCKFDLDQSLDGMRFLATLDRSTKKHGLQRLKRLVLERDGEVDSPEEFGLFHFDPTREELIRCKPGSISREQQPLIFVHGMWGKSEGWLPNLKFFSEQKVLRDRPLLVFRHPGNSSLARSGKLLHREMTAVVADPTRASFICHSAGGLIFRWYAEKLNGQFDRVIILATPHGGSNITQLKFLIDLQEFFSSLKLGLNDGIDQLISQGRGEIGLDLQPDSLFLRALGQNRDLAKRYHIFYGVMLRPLQAKLTAAGFLTLRRTLEARALPGIPDGIPRRQATKLLNSLVLPAEILQGDGVVSRSSARLPGAGTLTETRLDHLAIRNDSSTLQQVLESLTR